SYVLLRLNRRLQTESTAPFNYLRLRVLDLQQNIRAEMISLPLNGLVQKESIARAQIYDLTYRGIEEVSTTLNLTIRNKNYTDTYKQLGFLDTEQLLIRSPIKISFLAENFRTEIFSMKYQQKSRHSLKKYM
ncbi:MAG: hypothetical protein MZV64_69865, partial [Ignavibacteriales bacterium]|nr:hypothetical protein [Ignavibacteriales bacterium]